MNLTIPPFGGVKTWFLHFCPIKTEVIWLKRSCYGASFGGPSRSSRIPWKQANSVIDGILLEVWQQESRDISTILSYKRSLLLRIDLSWPRWPLDTTDIPVEISFTKSTYLGNKKSFDIVKKKVCFQVPVFVGVGRLIL